ncbi:MAG: hypothetical protein ACI9FN_001567 [Saprospiraceae bacterium]|jgi:hypothetical protein
MQNNLLESSLNTLGDRLFSLIGDGVGKDILKEKYDAFVKRAVNGDANQDQIEYVAANILNATNSQDTIQPDLATRIVDATDTSFKPGNTVVVEALVKKIPMSFAQTTSLGESLVKILKMNDNLKKSCSKKRPDEYFAEKVFYKFDKGIVMTLNEDIKSTLDEADFEEIIVELHELEKGKKMKWKKELSQALKMEHMAFRNEMKKVKELKMKHKDWEGMEDIEVFTFADSNFYAPYIPEVNMDSIMKTLELSLEGLGGAQELLIVN